jgi:hypothetical protein
MITVILRLMPVPDTMDDFLLDAYPATAGMAWAMGTGIAVLLTHQYRLSIHPYATI